MSRKATEKPFWQRKKLTEMTPQEWESLCDGCARCCLVKLEDEDDGTLEYTDIVCRYMDAKTCRCTDYANRSTLVPDCIQLTPENIPELHWMPPTCAYRLLAEGEDLPWWHPLVSGEQDSVHRAGISVRGKTVVETEVTEEEWEDHIVYWPLFGADDEDEDPGDNT